MPKIDDLLEALNCYLSGERDDLAAAIFHYYTILIVKQMQVEINYENYI